MAPISDRQFKFLVVLHECVRGQIETCEDKHIVGVTAGFSADETDAVCRQLYHAGMIRFPDGRSQTQICLARDGLALLRKQGY